MFIFRCLKKQTLLIINTSDGQTFSKSLQLCVKVECKFHGRVDKLSVFLRLSECSCDGVGLRVCQQLTSQISGLMFSDTDCDLIATLPLAMACAVSRASCVTWKWPITDVLFQLWLLPLHINHSWSVYPWSIGTFRNPSNPKSTLKHLNQKICADICSSSVNVTNARLWLCCIYTCCKQKTLHNSFQQFEFPSLILWPQTCHFGPFYLFHSDLQPQQFSVFSVNPIWTITVHAADSKGHHRLEIADVWSLTDNYSQCGPNTTWR